MKGLRLKRLSRRATTTPQLRYLAGLIDNSGENSIVLNDDGDVWLNIFSKSRGHIENLLYDLLHLEFGSPDVRVQEYRSGSVRLTIRKKQFAAPLIASLQPYLIVKRQQAEDYLNRSVRTQAPISSAYVAGVFDSRGGYGYWNFWYRKGYRYRYKNIRFASADVDYLWRIRRCIQAGIISVDKERGHNVRDLYVLSHDIFQLRISNDFHIRRVAEEIFLPHSTHPEKRAFLTEPRGERVWVGRR